MQDEHSELSHNESKWAECTLSDKIKDVADHIMKQVEIKASNTVDT